MAGKLKEIELQKFGGTEQLGKVKMHDFTHEVASVEEQSETKLEQDQGVGQVVFIRNFTFKANPEAFKEHPPTKQELFNYHAKGIEISLWRDGLQVMPEVEPRVVIEEDKAIYRIFVGAIPARGQILQDTPQTLSQLIHGPVSN